MLLAASNEESRTEDVLGAIAWFLKNMAEIPVKDQEGIKTLCKTSLKPLSKISPDAKLLLVRSLLCLTFFVEEPGCFYLTDNLIFFWTARPYTKNPSPASNHYISNQTTMRRSSWDNTTSNKKTVEKAIDT